MKKPAFMRVLNKEFHIKEERCAKETTTPKRREHGCAQANGLTSAMAKKRLEQEGENVLKSKNQVHAAKIFAGQFKDFLVIILLISTAVSVFLGEIAEAVSIAVIVLLNAIMGFVQEYKTEKTLEALKNMAAPTANVIRDGVVVKIEASSIVRGDVLLLEAGDRVPADCVLLEAVSMQAEEAVLTGESVAVDKAVDPTMDETNELNKTNLVYMGTSLVKGHGKARVIATGMNTQMGRIADMLGNIEEQPTPLQKRLDELGKFIVVGCLVISALVMGIGIMRGEPFIQMLITGVSLAVAAVPEGLPAIVTIALALAVKRMVKRKALVRKLHAVETLGCASVICSDKTGTLTENRMTVKQVATLEDRFEVEGSGYRRAGGFVKNGEHKNAHLEPVLELLLEGAALCNNAEITADKEQNLRDRSRNRSSGLWKTFGEPTEIALLVMSAKAGITRESLKDGYQIYDEIPFDSTRKCMSVFVKTPNGRRFIFTKGGYDVILPKCIQVMETKGARPLQHADRVHFDAVNEEMAGNGMRVLGFAYREITDETHKEEGLTFLGIAGLLDPPRKEAKDAVRVCRHAGVRTVMITGDHRLTACSIGEKVGIFRKGDVCLTGAELERMSDDALDDVIGKVTVFARVSPSHKFRIVRALKRRGEIVAMTGDGVNDAPAVKEADIGVSMGVTGSDVTKQAADVILLDDNFATLVAAIEEGRVIYGNIRKFIRYLLSCNIGEVVTMFVGMLMGMPVPLLPMQILMINLVTDGLPAIALGLEPAQKDTMRKPPRRADESIFSGGLVFTIALRGILIGFTTLFVFSVLFGMSGSLEIARTGAFLALVFTQLIHVFECKSEHKSIFKIPYFNNKKLLGAVAFSVLISIACVYLPQLNLLLRTSPLNGQQLFVTIMSSLLVPIVNAVVLGIKGHVNKPKLGDCHLRRNP